jgi:hypothetical protein
LEGHAAPGNRRRVGSPAASNDRSENDRNLRSMTRRPTKERPFECQAAVTHLG